jgi:hypothetical protein
MAVACRPTQTGLMVLECERGWQKRGRDGAEKVRVWINEILNNAQFGHKPIRHAARRYENERELLGLMPIV